MIKKAMGRRPSLHLFPHLFFFISKLTSTREEVDPPAKKKNLKKLSFMCSNQRHMFTSPGPFIENELKNQKKILNLLVWRVLARGPNFPPCNKWRKGKEISSWSWSGEHPIRPQPHEGAGRTCVNLSLNLRQLPRAGLINHSPPTDNPTGWLF
jgi:hypothetical protein